MRHRPAFAVALLALGLLALESLALAHEVEHDLDLHDDPECALHIFAGHFGKSANTELAIALLPAPTLPAPAAMDPATVVSATIAYRGRAPPLFSPVVIR